MALFGLKYYGELRSKHQGINWRVEIAQRGYVGDCEEMTFCGSDPIKVTWEKRGDDFYVPVKARDVAHAVRQIPPKKTSAKAEKARFSAQMPDFQ